MIETLEIKNFKSIKKKRFGLRNLNLLLGLNGMGKSSFVQMLLLLRQSRLQEGLRLNANLVSIGSARDALYQYAREENLSIFLAFTDGEAQQFMFDFRAESDLFPPSEHFELDQGFYQQALWHNQSFQYLNANRQEPTSIHRKSYSDVVSQRSLGNFGQFAAHFLETYGSSEVKYNDLIHPKSYIEDQVTGQKIVNSSLLNQVNLWLGEISPGVRVQVTSIQNTENIQVEYEFIQPNFGTTNRFKPTNVGFGISYVLPVVVSLLAARPGDLLIIENPESHIHPRGQAELGKLVAAAAANDVQIIIETHSDHFVNGVRVAVKEGLLDHSKAVLFYFEKAVTASEQFSKITDVEIDSRGELSSYPENMMDEWSNQLIKLV
jgi:predicted ATPase